MEELINELLGSNKTSTEKMFICDNRNIPFEEYVIAEYKYIKNSNKVNKASKYAYFITFTLKPDANEEAARNIIYDIPTKRKEALGIVKMDIVKEHTKNGTAHWHSYVESTKCIKKDRFNYYVKHYGNIDIKKAKHADQREIENYMLKEADEIEKLI